MQVYHVGMSWRYIIEGFAYVMAICNGDMSGVYVMRVPKVSLDM